MRYYLAMDGGGTKLQGILFDEEGNIHGTGLSGGINGNVHSPEAVQEHFRDCMTQLFSGKDAPRELEAIYLSQGMIRGHDVAAEFVTYKAAISAGEGTIGLLACGLTDGICALAGTGSDIFYVKDAKEHRVYGGWGYLMSDDGSGVWVGAQAARSWILTKTKIKEPTLLHRMMDEERPELQVEGGMIEAVYRNKTPAYYLGTYCPLVNRAAQAGDETAIAILRKGGELLAQEACVLIESLDLPEDYPLGTTGSVFRYCRPLYDSYAEHMKQAYPKMVLHRPRFEPVVGAMIYGLLQAGHTLDEDMMQRLEESCRAYRIEEEL